MFQNLHYLISDCENESATPSNDNALSGYDSFPSPGFDLFSCQDVLTPNRFDIDSILHTPPSSQEDRSQFNAILNQLSSSVNQ